MVITDHAQLIDCVRDKVAGHHIQSNIGFDKLRTETVASSGRYDLAESDLRRVHDDGAERDAQLRSELSQMSGLVAVGHNALAAAVASLATSFAELPQTTAGATTARPEAVASQPQSTTAATATSATRRLLPRLRHLHIRAQPQVGAN